MDNYRMRGSGMATRGEDPSKKIHRKERIKLLGKMNTRHMEMLSAGDYAGLLLLAQEYQELGAVRMAAQMRIEAENG